jgi:hypothetical protein
MLAAIKETPYNGGSASISHRPIELFVTDYPTNQSEGNWHQDFDSPKTLFVTDCFHGNHTEKCAADGEANIDDKTKDFASTSGDGEVKGEDRTKQPADCGTEEGEWEEQLQDVFPLLRVTAICRNRIPCQNQDVRPKF